MTSGTLRILALSVVVALTAGCQPKAPAIPAHQDPTDAPAVATGTGADPAITDQFDEGQRPLEYWIGRFESESREVFVKRAEIVEALEIAPGAHLADVGAGTGAFEQLLVDAVGPDGKVYAVDISELFLEHLREMKAAAGWENVEVVEASETSSNLAPDSVDVVLSVSTYHHFTYVAETLASMKSALRPGGRLIIIDFHRIPGVSTEWILGHVRADVETVRGEIEAAGFEFVRSIDMVEDSYIIEFTHAPSAERGP